MNNALSFYQTPETQFHSADSGNCRTGIARRSDSQQPVVGQPNSNPNLRSTPQVVVVGTSAVLPSSAASTTPPDGMAGEFEFPYFATIATKRDTPFRVTKANP
jgi:hypothetical protein